MSDTKYRTDTQCRKWQITINNPIEKGWTHDRIKEELSKIKSITYWCLADEAGKHTIRIVLLPVQVPSDFRL